MHRRSCPSLALAIGHDDKTVAPLEKSVRREVGLDLRASPNSENGGACGAPQVEIAECLPSFHIPLRHDTLREADMAAEFVEGHRVLGLVA